MRPGQATGVGDRKWGTRGDIPTHLLGVPGLQRMFVVIKVLFDGRHLEKKHWEGDRGSEGGGGHRGGDIRAPSTEGSWGHSWVPGSPLLSESPSRKPVGEQEGQGSTKGRGQPWDPPRAPRGCRVWGELTSSAARGWPSLRGAQVGVLGRGVHHARVQRRVGIRPGNGESSLDQGSGLAPTPLTAPHPRHTPLLPFLCPLPTGVPLPVPPPHGGPSPCAPRGALLPSPPPPPGMGGQRDLLGPPWGLCRGWGHPGVPKELFQGRGGHRGGWERAAGASDKERHCSAVAHRRTETPPVGGPKGESGATSSPGGSQGLSRGPQGHLLHRGPKEGLEPGLGTQRKQNQTIQYLLRAEGSRNKCPFSMGKLLQGMVLWRQKSGIQGWSWSLDLSPVPAPGDSLQPDPSSWMKFLLMPPLCGTNPECERQELPPTPIPALRSGACAGASPTPEAPGWEHPGSKESRELPPPAGLRWR